MFPARFILAEILVLAGGAILTGPAVLLEWVRACTVPCGLESRVMSLPLMPATALSVCPTYSTPVQHFTTQQ